MLWILGQRIRALKQRSDDGIAMVMVIGVGSVLTLLIVAAVATGLGSMKKASTDQDWNAALAATYAGIEEYQSLLADDPSYVQYGNPASVFSKPTPPLTAATVALPTGVRTNPAFSLGASGTWATVPGSDGKALFRYEVDNSTYANTGTIRLRATGKVGSETRSIVADLRQKGFIDFLYFTDFEMSDPSVFNQGCAVNYAWLRGGSCVIQFGAADVIGGPVHSNDELQICGAHFLGVVTTARAGGGYVNCGASSTFDFGPPQYSPKVGMPATNTQLIKETRSDLPVDVPRPGCLYTGPTRIELLATQSSGKARMTVWSPWTKVTNITGDTQSGGTAAAACGTLAALQSTSGATIDVPLNNVVYVQNIPLTGVNASTEAATTNGSSCKKYHASGSGSNISQNVVGFPMSGEVAPNNSKGSSGSYGCRNGDLFIKGTLNGTAVTVAAQNYIYVTGDIKYKNAESDMLGLVGDNAVWVYNPMDSMGSSSADPLLTGSNRQIDAAILSVAHTFTVQNYNIGGARGTLTVNGAIAQKFRGIVKQNGGYVKDYVYDKRFRYTAPPKFLSPVTTTYGVNTWIEINPVFNADGAYR